MNNGTLKALTQLFSDSTKLYLIDYRATWCAPCRIQRPHLQEIAKQYQDKLQVIAFSLDRERKMWQQFIDKHHEQYSGVPVKVYNPPKSALMRFFKIHSIPRYILLSKGGETVLQAKMPPRYCAINLKKPCKNIYKRRLTLPPKARQTDQPLSEELSIFFA